MNRLLLAVLALSLATARPAAAQAYRWVDKDGVVHLTDNPYDLPEPQRRQVLQRLEQQRLEKERREKERNAAPGAAQSPRPDVGGERLPDGPVQVPDLSDRIERPQPGGEPMRVDAKNLNQTPQDDRAQKHEEWKGRMQQAREAVAGLEAKCQQAKDKGATGRLNSVMYGRGADRQAAQDGERELQDCQQELEAARHRLEVELPDQARRAGIPPGWLRE